MLLSEIKSQFNEKKIDKHEFITKMYEQHLVLGDYANFLAQSGISKIEIGDGQLIFTSRATPYHTGGLRFLTNIDDKRVTPLEAFNFGRYEDEDSEMIYKLLDKSFVVFDIGGNIGWYTTHIAKMLTNGKLYAFEPIPATFKNLQQNVQLNALQNVVLNNIALSDSKGELSFYYSSKMTGASSSQNITNNENAVLVKCITNTLDSYCKENSIERIDFIKCDVEGAELFAIKGGLEAISTFKPIVFTEMLRKWAQKFNYHPNDIVALFKSMDYKCFINYSGKLKQIEVIDELTIDTNFFFLHKEKHASQIDALL